MGDLRKSTKEKLLGSLFAEHRLIQQGSSNNGYYFVLEKGSAKSHVKVVDADQEDEEGLDETKLSTLSASSSHIAHLKNAGDIDGRYKFLEFEYIDGQDLQAVGSQRQLTPAELMKAAKQLTAAISDLWDKRIVHRDIKPANIMLDKNGDFKLVDLGIGYYIETPDVTNTKTKGSRYYSSPEQFFASTDSNVKISFASDLYSLAMVLFQLAAGKHPKSTWGKDHNSYGELITQTPPPKIEEYRSDLPKELIVFINKNLAIYAADRFLSTSEALDILNGKDGKEHGNKVFLHDTSTSYAVIDSYLSDKNTVKPDGIVVSMLQGAKRVSELRKLGLEVMIDPLTYRLPYPQAKNSDLKKKLGYKKKAAFDIGRIRKETRNIIQKVLELQGDASACILPFFAILSLDDELLEVNKNIWHSGKDIAGELGIEKKIYGGIAVPSSLIESETAVNKLCNLIIGHYDIDGFYLILEAPNDSAKTIDNGDYLNGVNKLARVFASMGDVMIGNADIALRLVTDNTTLCSGWSTSKRRFRFDTEFGRKKTGFNAEYDPKLLYYIPELITFVKGEVDAETLGIYAPENTIQCPCDNCKQLSPFDGKSPKDLALAEYHYYDKALEQFQWLNGSPDSRKRKVLDDAIELARKIVESSDGTVGSEIIPSYETILGTINN